MLKQTIFLFWLLCLVSICKADAGAGAKGEKENEGKGAGEAKERKLKLPAKFAEFYTTEVDGKIFKVPAYDQKTVLSDARYNFDRKLAHDFAKSVPSFTSALIDNRRGWPAVLWHETWFKLKCLPNYFRNKDLKAIDTSPKLESGFGDGTGKMLNRLIANDESDLTRDEAKKRFTNVMKAVEEIVQESSTGLALNWPAMTVDNETLEEYLKPAMGKLLQASPTIIKTLKEAAIRLRQSGDTPSELSGEDMILVGKSDKEYKKALSSGKIKSEDS